MQDIPQIDLFGKVKPLSTLRLVIFGKWMVQDEEGGEFMWESIEPGIPKPKTLHFLGTFTTPKGEIFEENDIVVDLINSAITGGGSNSIGKFVLNGNFKSDHTVHIKKCYYDQNKRLRLESQLWRRRQTRRVDYRRYYLPKPTIKRLNRDTDGNISVEYELQMAPNTPCVVIEDMDVNIYIENQSFVYICQNITVKRETQELTKRVVFNVPKSDIPEKGIFRIRAVVESNLKDVHMKESSGKTKLVVTKLKSTRAVLHKSRDGQKMFGFVKWTHQPHVIITLSVLIKEGTGDWVKLFDGVLDNNKHSATVNDIPIGCKVKFQLVALARGPYGGTFYECDVWMSNVLSQYDISANECVICTEVMNFENSPDMPVIPNGCCHMFHVKCLSRWSEKKRTCPLCLEPFHGAFYDLDHKTSYPAFNTLGCIAGRLLIKEHCGVSCSCVTRKATILHNNIASQHSQIPIPNHHNVSYT